MLTIAICDDSLTDRIILEKLIRQYGDNNGIDMLIDGYHSAELLIEAVSRNDYMLVFMDIFLGGMQGNEAARILLEEEERCVIFTTSSVEYALEGFEIGVLHYIVKPYSYEKIAKAMEKYIKAYYADSLEVVSVKPVGNEPETVLRQKDICYIESFDKIRCIHLKKNDIKTYMTMNELTERLSEKIFCRPHRSYIVNMSFVSSVERNALLLNSGTVIPISRSAYDTVVESCNRYNG